MIHVRHTHNDIEHPDAYDKAVRNYIKANASKTRRQYWLDTVPDAQRLMDYLTGSGDFKDEYNQYGELVKSNPLRNGIFAGDFGKTMLAMRNALEEWGGLTDKQTDLVRRALTRAEDRLVKANQRREERIAADRAISKHVGTVGERREFALTVNKVFSFESQYGRTFINICKDADGNVIVYKGSNGFEEGDALTLKATVKAHDEREGVKQTLIARPKILSEKESDL
jgi:hypothetical protein